MKETVGSLRFYFILVGVAGGLSSLLSILAGPSLLGVVLVGIGLALAGGFLYAGIRLRELLATSPDRIKQLVYANIAVVVLTTVLDLAYGYTQGLLRAAIALAISVYLLSSVTRLSNQIAAEATAEPAQAS